MQLDIRFIKDWVGANVKPAPDGVGVSPSVDLNPIASALGWSHDRPDALPQYLPMIRTVHLPSKIHGTDFILQLRTPSDAERFGHHLQSASVTVLGHTDGSGIRSICYNSNHFRIQYRSPDELKSWVNSDEAGRPLPAQFLWTFVYKSNSILENSIRHSDAIRYCAVPMARILQECGTLSSLTTEDSVSLIFDCERLLRDASFHSSQMADFSKYGIVDDPAMLSRFVEESLTPNGIYGFLIRILPTVMSTPNLPLETRASFCDAIGDMGRPPFFDFEFIQQFPDAKFMEAILFSRWEWDWTAEHSAACLKVLASEPVDSRAAFAAVESLVRMDEVDQVPDPHLLSWYDHAVCRPDADSNTAIGILSRQPTGRTFLQTRLGSKDQRKIQTTIRMMLRIRAESTQRTKRWDFMTEAECEQILALPAPPTPGKDTEGGAARPFPSDE